ncbi:Ppx/GppA family phosphatase [Actinoalloteichus sp. AHMU CJ021]|uniref:Exopolyphosphatase / guanosine-5'-triphosphate,3'-diphosphate pyrophosphatase n=1 Tax=Actinoalloteichus caeruleus DSM 43889 TaxID=1120930 RepID=A0ABT1JIR0_ACTCY|nr:Ppx/GppA phosphatase family protein [Actinoalloteichus caeruleus]AUS78318.1 Ppx/GppA family phosphatase [Actinoalloteichus sp. AHMU CJ021]MCP2332394.1 exopolyphosphatase / guanosine-5'-triphosphate,3'-diphosphate pyrophosphatase [Actinoalloteichus caeruleus DSM 43889]
MPRTAAIDCGTNSIRLLIADVSARESGGTTLTDVRREMRIVRLGQGVDATGQLAPEAVERTRVALAEYVDIIERSSVDRVRMVATSATRDARNREDFFSMVRGTLGTEAEVISGDEEARLSFAGAVADLDPSDGPFLVVDVGGGSTEFVLGDWDGVRARVRAARSVDVGCVRLTERCLRDDPPTAEQVAAARAVVRDITATAFSEVPVAEATTWVGVAGTVTTLSGLAQGLAAYDPAAIHLSRLSHERIASVTDWLVTSPHARRAEEKVIHPGRVDVITGGAVVVAELADRVRATAGIDELVVSEHDILDGIALSVAG